MSRIKQAPERVEDWRALPTMIDVVREHRGCPHCEGDEFGAIDPFAERLTYRCYCCGGLFRGRPGIDVAESEA